MQCPGIRHVEEPERWQEERVTRQEREARAARVGAARNLEAGSAASPEARETGRPGGAPTARAREKRRRKRTQKAPTRKRAGRRRRSSTPATSRSSPASTSNSSSSRSGSSTRVSGSSSSSKAGMRRARAGSSSASPSASTRGYAGWWRSARRRSARRPSGTSSATSPNLPAAGEMVLFDRSWYNRAGGGTGDGLLHGDRVPGVPALLPRVRADAGALRHSAPQVLVLGERRGAGKAFPVAHHRPHQALEAEPDGSPVAFALDGVLPGQGRDVRSHRHQAGALVRGERGQQEGGAPQLHQSPARSDPLRGPHARADRAAAAPGCDRLRAPARQRPDLRARSLRGALSEFPTPEFTGGSLPRPGPVPTVSEGTSRKYARSSRPFPSFPRKPLPPAKAGGRIHPKRRVVGFS